MGLFDVKSEDMAEGIFRTKSGKVVTTHQDYLQISGRRYCEVLGDKGRLIWDSSMETITLSTATGNKIFKAPAIRNKMYTEELKFFMNKVKKREKFSNLGESIHDLKNALAIKKNKI